MPFSHEKLQVYQKALSLLPSLRPQLREWPSHMAARDQLVRALESVLINIAKGCAQGHGPQRVISIEYAIGSVLESAACMDAAQIHGLLAVDSINQCKAGLSEVVRMLYGLRSSWADQEVREGESLYGTPVLGQARVFFLHETLTVYRLAIDFLTWTHRWMESGELPTRSVRSFDAAGTGILLNIAEGNGRFSELDHARFLAIAEECVVKCAAYLDIAQADGMLSAEDMVDPKKTLVRVAGGLRNLRRKLQSP